jgi:hypothetical protein
MCIARYCLSASIYLPAIIGQPLARRTESSWTPRPTIVSRLKAVTDDGQRLSVVRSCPWRRGTDRYDHAAGACAQAPSLFVEPRSILIWLVQHYFRT